MVCFFIYFDILICIKVLFWLNRNLVKVCVNLVLLILVGFKNINELIGCFGFFILVFVFLIAVVIIFIVFDCLIIFWCRYFFNWSNFWCFDFNKWFIGMFVYLVMIVVIFLFVICLWRKDEFWVWIFNNFVFLILRLWCIVFSCLYFNWVVVFKL